VAHNRGARRDRLLDRLLPVSGRAHERGGEDGYIAREAAVKGPFGISVEQEGLFLLRVWHEGGEGDVWGYALDRVMPDDTVAGRPIPGINAVAYEIQPPGSGERAPRRLTADRVDQGGRHGLARRRG